MKLYIGNATRQVHAFAYWVIGGKSARTQHVPMGGQVQITGDLSAAEIDFIVKQHVPYGLVEVSEIDRTKVFTGICYSVDKPIPANRLQRLMLHNQTMLIRQGEEIRKAAAIVSTQQLEADLREQRIPEQLRAFEASIEEVDPPQQADYTPLSEGVRVEPDAPGQAPTPGLRQRGKRAA